MDTNPDNTNDVDVTTTRPLTEEETDNGYEPAANRFNYNPDRYDFKWSKDYGAFKAHKLLWWDDASYIRYQSDDSDAMDYEREEAEKASEALSLCEDHWGLERCDNGNNIPF